MTMSESDHDTPKEWNLEMLENLVAQEDIPLIYILTLRQSNRMKNIAGAIPKVGCIWLNHGIGL